MLHASARKCCTFAGRGARRCWFARSVLVNLQECCEDPCLAMQVLPRDPEYPLPNHMCRLDPLNHRPGCRLRARSLHGPEPSLDGAVVRFEPVITVSSYSLSLTVAGHLLLAVPGWPPDSCAARRMRRLAAIGCPRLPRHVSRIAWRPHDRVSDW